MGGAYIKISYELTDEVIKEIIFQIISKEKYSFSDNKTISLINMVEKFQKLMLQYSFMGRLELEKKLFPI